MMVCGNQSTFYQKNTEMMPDILYSLLPYHKVSPLPEIFLYTLLASAVGRMIFHRDGVAIARRLGAIASCTYIIRSITLVATTLPSPHQDCLDYEPSWSFSSFFGDCADTTGHTVNLTLVALIWSQYTQHRLLYIVAWLTSLSAMFLFIVNRTHYTIDIIISFLLSVFFWNYYHSSLSLPSTEQNRMVKWFEKVDNNNRRDEEMGERKGESGGVGGISLATVTEVLESVTNNMNINNNNKDNKFYKELVESADSTTQFQIESPAVPSKFKELVEDLGGSPGPSRYTELSHNEDA